MKKKKKKNGKKTVYELKKKLCKKYPKKYDMDMCLAKKKNKNSKNKRCRKKAIEGTGRCKLHGGMSTGPLKHGKYSRYFKENIKDRYEHFRRDPRILDLKDELALLRALIVEARDVIDEDDTDPKAAFFLRDQMSKLIDLVGKNIERMYKIKGATVSIEAIPILIRQFVGLMAKLFDCCPSCGHKFIETRKLMYAEMMSVKLPTQDWPGQKTNEIVDAEFEVVKQ